MPEASLNGQRTLRLQAGDAVVLDYRLLHGTHANDTARRRDCVPLLSFIPAWGDLPMEMRAHLSMHHAPPELEAASRSASWYAETLRRFDGARASLRLNRVPPPWFTVSD